MAKKNNGETAVQEEFDVDEALERLEEINEALADQDAKLGESMKLYQEGVKLAEQCKKHLAGVEQQLEILNVQE